MKSQVLLTIPDDLLGEVDAAVKELGITRTRFLLEATRRNLEFVTKAELPVLRELRRVAVTRNPSKNVHGFKEFLEQLTLSESGDPSK